MATHQQLPFDGTEVSMAAAASSTAARALDPWCQRRDRDLVWDGVDFDACWRIRTLDGILPIVFISLSLLFAFISLIFAVRSHLHRRRRTTGGTSINTNATYSELSFIDPDTDADSPIAQAENEVILSAVEALAAAALPHDEPSKSWVLLRSIWSTKKDALSVLGSGTVVGLLAWRFVANRQVDGVNWWIFGLAAWSWITLLGLVRLALAFAFNVRTFQSTTASPLSPLYSTLDLHIVPWYALYTVIAFFDLRSTVIVATSVASHHNSRQSVQTASLILGFTLLVLFLELFSPRYSPYDKSAIAPTTKGTPLRPSPEIGASLFSQATYSYLDGFLLRSGFPRLLKQPDMSMDTVPDLRPDDKTAGLLLAYRRDCRNLTSLLPKSRPPGFALKLAWHFRWALLEQQAWSYVRVTVVALPPLFLKGLLGHIAKRARGEEAPVHVALLYAFSMFTLQVIASISSAQGLYVGRRICTQIRSVIIGEAFTKALRRKDLAGSSISKEKTGDEVEDAKIIEEELSKATTGKIMNLISIDTFHLSEVCGHLHYIWPEQLLTMLVAVLLLFYVIGWSALAGVLVMVAIVPIQTQLSKRFIVYQGRVMKAADARLNLATEVISSIRIVKYFAWERKFLDLMSTARAEELDALWQRSVFMVHSLALLIVTPMAISIATFVVHTKVLHRDLTAETAFSALALFSILRTPFQGFTHILVGALEAHISLKRLDEFLNEEETHKYTIVHQPTSASDPVIGFVDASFTWSNAQRAREDATIFRVSNLDLSFPVEKLSIVLGPVGSGKTTLLLSLLGESNCLSGSSYLPSPIVRGTGGDPSILTNTTAYAAQSPWLMSESIRENIVFGSDFNEKRYQDVLDACALRPDLKQFELGDETEVGEKGTVLSGGQKARISLARAVYSPAKHVLLDDVLSAVDSHTAQHLVRKCFSGPLMRNRTIVLVTHAVDLCLPVASFVVTMDSGNIVSSGPPEDLSERVLEALKAHPDAPEEPTASTIEAVAEGETDQELLVQQAEEERARKEKLKLVKAETSSTGAVSGRVYMMFINAMGGLLICAFALSIYAVGEASTIGVSVALRYWSNSYDTAAQAGFVTTMRSTIHVYRSIPVYVFASVEKPFAIATSYTPHDSDYWLKVYCLSILVNLGLSYARSLFFFRRTNHASRIIYQDVIHRLLGAPTRFFDTVPSGRILNRLSKDIGTIDRDLAMSLMFFLFEVCSVIGILVTISTVLPIFLIAAGLISVLYALIAHIYLSSSRELNRMTAVSRSPVISIFGEALTGVATIRSYGDSTRHIKQTIDLLDSSNRPFLTYSQATQWLTLRVDIIGALITLIAATIVLYTPSMDSALAGFVLSFSIAVSERVMWLVRLWSNVEVQANSVERVQEYIEIDQESKEGIVPPAIWPSRDGSIEVEGLTATYAADLPPVLKNVSFTVQPREKVGICGRTGSGKSTLGLSFFRFIEPTSGRIVIDGIDINKLSLHELRSRLTIVAQETALFAGTLRFNLDPFGAEEDAAIWDALRRVQMAAPTSALPTPLPSRPASVRGGESVAASEDVTVTEESEKFVVKSLEMEVSEGGKNFSAGQRQLLALARGILKLRTSSILILDESTASLDHATDERIQQTIREEMSNATILCIAHRLRTLIDFDKTLVLGAGEVLEYDSPANLLDNENSAFSELCRKSGEYDELKTLAFAKRDAGMKK